MSNVTKIVSVHWREYRIADDGECYDFDDRQNFVCGEDVTEAIQKARMLAEDIEKRGDYLDRFVLLGTECLAQCCEVG